MIVQSVLTVFSATGLPSALTTTVASSVPSGRVRVSCWFAWGATVQESSPPMVCWAPPTNTVKVVLTAVWPSPSSARLLRSMVTVAPPSGAGSQRAEMVAFGSEIWQSVVTIVSDTFSMPGAVTSTVRSVASSGRVKLTVVVRPAATATLSFHPGRGP